MLILPFPRSPGPTPGESDWIKRNRFHAKTRHPDKSEPRGNRPPYDRRTGATVTPGRGGTRRGGATDGAPCKGGRKGWGPEATQGAPRSSRQSGVVAVLPIGTHTPPNPHIAFRRAPPYGDRKNNLPKRQAAARARRAKPGATRRQARAQRCARQGGLRVGVGGRCSQTKPRTQPNPPPPQHPRQREPFDATPSVERPCRVPPRPVPYSFSARLT